MADHAPITPSTDSAMPNPGMPSPGMNELMSERRAFWSSFTGATKYAVIVIVLLVIGLYVFFG